MKRWRLGLCVLAIVGLLMPTAWAAGEDKAPRPWAPMGTSFGPCGSGVPSGLFGVGGNISYGESDNQRKHSEEVSNSTAKTDKMTEVLKLRYGFMPGTDIRTATPFYNIHIDNEVAKDRTNYGVGDTSILFHTVLWNQDKGDPFYFAIDYGGTVPTGSVGTHSVDAIGADAWGLTGGAGITYFLGSNRFDMEANYSNFTEGAHGYTKGDRVRWNTGYAYAINNLWDIGAESCFEWDDESEKNGVLNKDSYYEWYVGPKVVLKYQPWGTNFALGTEFPVARWYQATKTGSDDFRVNFKVIKFFDIGGLFN